MLSSLPVPPSRLHSGQRMRVARLSLSYASQIVHFRYPPSLLEVAVQWLGLMPRLVSKSLSSRATRYTCCRPSPSPTIKVHNMPAFPSRARPNLGGSSRRLAPTHTHKRTRTYAHVHTHTQTPKQGGTLSSLEPYVIAICGVCFHQFFYIALLRQAFGAGAAAVVAAARGELGEAWRDFWGPCGAERPGGEGQPPYQHTLE